MNFKGGKKESPSLEHTAQTLQAAFVIFTHALSRLLGIVASL
jgi:hypothetical protein